MPRKARNLLGNIICHHMVQGINKEYIFQKDEDKEKYLKLLKKYYKNFNVQIIAYCIMDNHVHFLLYSERIQNISNFMRQVNSEYAKYYNLKRDRVGYVFRNRFESVPIMKIGQLYTCIKYIHMNPVKSEIVVEEKDYRYSSYNDYLNKTGFINEKILRLVFNSSNNYLEIFNSIEYEKINTEKEKIDTEKVLKEFLFKERKRFKEIQKNKVLIQKFISYLISNQYQFSKKELARALKMSRATFYRRLYG